MFDLFSLSSSEKTLSLLLPSQAKAVPCLSAYMPHGSITSISDYIGLQPCMQALILSCLSLFCRLNTGCGFNLGASREQGQRQHLMQMLAR